MPVELKEIDLERKIANTDDSGILVQTKPRLYVKNPQTDVVNWLKTFADDYWKLRVSTIRSKQAKVNISFLTTKLFL